MYVVFWNFGNFVNQDEKQKFVMNWGKMNFILSFRLFLQ